MCFVTMECESKIHRKSRTEQHNRVEVLELPHVINERPPLETVYLQGKKAVQEPNSKKTGKNGEVQDEPVTPGTSGKNQQKEIKWHGFQTKDDKKKKTEPLEESKGSGRTFSKGESRNEAFATRKEPTPNRQDSEASKRSRASRTKKKKNVFICEEPIIIVEPKRPTLILDIRTPRGHTSYGAFSPKITDEPEPRTKLHFRLKKWPMLYRERYDSPPEMPPPKVVPSPKEPSKKGFRSFFPWFRKNKKGKTRQNFDDAVESQHGAPQSSSPKKVRHKSKSTHTEVPEIEWIPQDKPPAQYRLSRGSLAESSEEKCDKGKFSRRSTVIPPGPSAQSIPFYHKHDDQPSIGTIETNGSSTVRPSTILAIGLADSHSDIEKIVSLSSKESVLQPPKRKNPDER